MSENDAQLELKKRARRRLVGAAALAVLAAIVLPMVMDQAPKQQPAQDIQIRPGQVRADPGTPAGTENGRSQGRSQSWRYGNQAIRAP